MTNEWIFGEGLRLFPVHQHGMNGRMSTEQIFQQANQWQLAVDGSQQKHSRQLLRKRSNYVRGNVPKSTNSNIVFLEIIYIVFGKRCNANDWLLEFRVVANISRRGRTKKCSKNTHFLELASLSVRVQNLNSVPVLGQ